MKLYLNLAALAVTLAPSLTTVHAGFTATCAEQSPCISFSVTKLSADACGVGGDCPVEVCLNLNGGNDGCLKGGGSTNTFSHMCMMSDGTNGCPTYKEDGTTPLLGGGTGSSCSASGQWSGTAAFDGNCNDGQDVVMCQEGKPGDVLYWQIKDGADNGIESGTFDKIFTLDGTTECSTQVECFNNEMNCGETFNTAQSKFERTWKFTIPDSSSGCDICASTPDFSASSPSSPAISPGAPTEPSTPTAPGDVTLLSSPTSDTTPTSTTTDDAAGTEVGSKGDPHFKSWIGEHFEFHGQCDLILARDDSFADGLGLDVQIRTKLVRYWSYIKRVAIRIGEDILEIEGDADHTEEKPIYWVNFEYQKASQTEIGGFPFQMIVGGGRFRKHHMTIDLSSKYPGVQIQIHTYKEFIRVDFVNSSEEAFGNVEGILGNYKTGKTLARDGATIIHDFNELGNEWQIKPEDNMLFHDVSDPQFPKRCVLPEDPQGKRRRRLDESSVSEEAAEEACSGLTDELDRKECVYDIIATQDLDMAGAY